MRFDYFSGCDYEERYRKKNQPIRTKGYLLLV